MYAPQLGWRIDRRNWTYNTAQLGAHIAGGFNLSPDQLVEMPNYVPAIEIHEGTEHWGFWTLCWYASTPYRSTALLRTRGTGEGRKPGMFYVAAYHPTSTDWQLALRTAIVTTMTAIPRDELDALLAKPSLEWYGKLCDALLKGTPGE